VTGLKSIAVTPTNPSIASGPRSNCRHRPVQQRQRRESDKCGLPGVRRPGCASIGATGLASAIGIGQTRLKRLGRDHRFDYVAVTSTSTYTIGGTISSLSGSGLVLQDNAATTSRSLPGQQLSRSAHQSRVAAHIRHGSDQLPVRADLHVTNGSGTATANVTTSGSCRSTPTRIWTFVTFAVAVPLPLVTVQVCAGLEGCVRTVRYMRRTRDWCAERESCCPGSDREVCCRHYPAAPAPIPKDSRSSADRVGAR